MSADPSEPFAVLLRDLSRPEAYAHAPVNVEVLQTHISALFFAGDRVYKVKKPVDLGFLDFTTLERRRHFCEQEVRLNRRLAPETYLGVVPITRSDAGALRVDGAGEPVEWAVEMKRLPAHRMLSALLDRGEVDNELIHTVADRLASFHAAAATGDGVDEHGLPEAVARRVEQNFEQLEPFCRADGCVTPTQLRFLRERSRAFLAAERELFERRVREGHIRDGHGDLHADNLCFPDGGLVAYDCIEFSEEFRCGDTACDVAFLAMDLDRRGYPGFSGYLMKRYATVSGDDELRTLESFYKSYRAVVRSKVAALTSVDETIGPEERERAACESMRYVQLAAAYELPPALILTCGLPAGGKSWLARRLAGALRAAVLRTDVRRKLRTSLEPTARAADEYGAGLYTDAAREAVYRSALEDALGNLRAGHSTIVDATFSRRRFRAPFVDAAERMGLPYFVLHVTAPDDVVRERLARRAADPDNVSDAGLEVYLAESKAFEPPDEVPRGHVIECTSDADVPERQSSAVIDRMIALSGGPSVDSGNEA